MSAIMMLEAVPLTLAAQRLRRRYRSTLDLVLLGHLTGQQDPDTRRWYVDAESLAAYLRTQSPAACPEAHT